VIDNVPVRPGTVLLDMGCGTGQLFGDLEDHFGDTPFSYTGVDQSERMVEAARAKYPGGNFRVASAEGYRGADRTWDVIVCTHSFPYFPDKPHLLVKLHNMLKNGGVLLIAQASVNNLYDLVVLSLVKLSTSKAQYPSRRRMGAMAKPAFGSAPEETRISPSLLVPSIYLFRWTRNDGAES